MRNLFGRPGALVAGLVAVGALIAAPVAQATSSPTYTWTGGGSSSDGNTPASTGDWADPANWSLTGAGAPATDPQSPANGGDFVFTHLAGCAGFGNADSCYQSTFSLPGTVAGTLTLQTTVPYDLAADSSRDPLRLDPAPGDLGIDAEPFGGPGLGSAPQIATPLLLADSQDWAVTGGDGGGLDIEGPVNGVGRTLGVTLASGGSLSLDGHLDTGAITFRGPVTGWANTPQGNGVVELLQDSTGPVTADDVQLSNVNDGSDLSVGGLTLDDASFDPGTGMTSTGALTMSGQDTTDITIGSLTNDPVVSAAGNVTLAGNLTLGLAPNGGGSCPTETTGATATLFRSTGGSLTANLSDDGTPLTDGTVVQIPSSCGGQAQVRSYPARVNITGNALILTYLTATTTTVDAQTGASPSVNQPLTIVAHVTQGNGATPQGTVDFTESGLHPTIPGCGAAPVASDGTATCTTDELDGGRSTISAAFSPSNPATVAPSDTTEGGGTSFTIDPDATTTALAASSSSAPPGDTVTYTATVTPADSGTLAPTGTVEFFDDGDQLCAAALAGDAATCAVTYGNGDAGAHTITATYEADGNFASSNSVAVSVRVAAATRSGGASAGAGSAGSGSAGNGPAAPAAPAAPVSAPAGPATGSAPAGPARGTGASTVKAPVATAGGLTVPISCAAGGAGCTVTTRVTAVQTLRRHGRVVHRTVVIGTKRTTVAAGASTSVHVTLNSAGRKLLAAHKSLKTTVTVTTGSGESTKTVAAKKVTLTATKPHRKKK